MCSFCADYRCHQRLCYHDCNRHDCADRFAGNMGTGALGMFETSMVVILVAICALIKNTAALPLPPALIKQVFGARKGRSAGMGLLVGLMDIATANNTVAIVMANPIAKEMSKDYGISSRKAASILDTFSCVFQGILPLRRTDARCHRCRIRSGRNRRNAFEIMPKLFLSFICCLSVPFCSSFSERKSRNKAVQLLDVLPQPQKTFYKKRKNKYFKGVEKIDTLFLRFISLNFLCQLAQLHPTLHPFLKLRLQCFLFGRKLL